MQLVPGARTKPVNVSAALHFTDLSNSSISMNKDNLVHEIQVKIRARASPRNFLYP
jgi:hypothetical protein